MRPSAATQTVVVQSDEVSRVIIIDGTTVIRYFGVETDNRFLRSGGGWAIGNDRTHQLVRIANKVSPGSVDLRVLVAII